MSLPSAVTGAGIWLRQDSLRHILASAGYDPETIEVNVTWIEREFNACQMPLSMYPIYLFPAIQPQNSKVRRFSTFFAHFGLPWVRPWDNRGKFTRLERGFNACKTPHCIYPSIFNRF